MTKLAPTLMIQGTASDVGKSLIVTALCRILANDGYRVAPFKSQNMSNNSHVTPDGKEIGRAQAVQADACRIPATTDMNPILLKPTGERRAQVVVHGKPLRDYDAIDYREKVLPTAERFVREALDRLRAAHDVVVMEGAGSPAEVNLRDRDIVNMRAAAWGDAPVVLVADIDRGGVFASIVGTMAILRPEERDRVRGFIINKFRGDPALLTDGLAWLEAETGKPVLGVVPMLSDVGLEDEDAASLDNKLRTGSRTEAAKALDIAVLRLPLVSNFTDVDALAGEPDVSIRYVSRLEEWGSPDAVVIPGTKNTLLDLAALRERGLDAAVQRYATQGGRLVGICGGYQMLGLTLHDPHGVESSEPAADRGPIEGLGLLPAETTYAPEKRTERVAGAFAGWPGDPPRDPIRIEGYEIHMGATSFREPAAPLFRFDDGTVDGASSADGRVWGTYVHGIFDNDEFRRAWLNALRQGRGLPPLPAAYRHREKREAAFDRLADHVRRHVDLDAIYAMMGISRSEATK